MPTLHGGHGAGKGEDPDERPVAQLAVGAGPVKDISGAVGVHHLGPEPFDTNPPAFPQPSVPSLDRIPKDRPRFAASLRFSSSGAGCVRQGALVLVGRHPIFRPGREGA